MRRHACCAALMLLMLACCGVPVQEKPSVAPEAALPPERAEPPTDLTTPDQQSIEVYLVQSDRLVRVERHVDAATLEASLSELAAGPNETEVDEGLRTAIPPDASLRVRARSRDVASVGVTTAFLNVTGEEQVLAIAQVVFTATAVAGVSSVQFVIDGEPTDVPLADGTLSPTPVSREDYGTIAPAS